MADDLLGKGLLTSESYHEVAKRELRDTAGMSRLLEETTLHQHVYTLHLTHKPHLMRELTQHCDSYEDTVSLNRIPWLLNSIPRPVCV